MIDGMSIPVEGDRIALIYTDDEFTELKGGDEGTVTSVVVCDDEMLLSISWDSGSNLMLSTELGDKFKPI